MIRYFNMPATHTVVALVIEPDSFAAKAPAKEFGKRFGCEMDEISHKEYVKLRAAYEEEMRDELGDRQDSELASGL